MPLNPNQIEFRLSGGPTNSNALASIGGEKSSTAISGNAAVVFDKVASVESTAGDQEYRILYVHNAHPTLTLENAVAWLSANTASASTTIAIGAGASAINGTEPALANESAAPPGVTFSAAATLGAAVALGNIPPGQSKAIALRRTVTAGAGASNDAAEIRIEGGYTE